MSEVAATGAAGTRGRRRHTRWAARAGAAAYRCALEVEAEEKVCERVGEGAVVFCDPLRLDVLDGVLLVGRAGRLLRNRRVDAAALALVEEREVDDPVGEVPDPDVERALELVVREVDQPREAAKYLELACVARAERETR